MKTNQKKKKPKAKKVKQLSKKSIQEPIESSFSFVQFLVSKIIKVLKPIQ